jgi:type IV pilus assembly protein PilA
MSNLMSENSQYTAQADREEECRVFCKSACKYQTLREIVEMAREPAYILARLWNAACSVWFGRKCVLQVRGDGMKKQNGFSLIELLIVVAIILIIAAIAIPNLLRSKIAANEASAVASCKAINTAEIVYSTTYTSTTIFSTDLLSLGDGGVPSNCGNATTVPTASAACLIDSALENATQTAKSGYLFTYTPSAGGSYSVTAGPITVNGTGTRYFYTDQSAVIRANPGALATNSSSPI